MKKRDAVQVAAMRVAKRIQDGSGDPNSWCATELFLEGHQLIGQTGDPWDEALAHVCSEIVEHGTEREYLSFVRQIANKVDSILNGQEV